MRTQFILKSLKIPMGKYNNDMLNATVLVAKTGLEFVAKLHIRDITKALNGWELDLQAPVGRQKYHRLIAITDPGVQHVVDRKVPEKSGTVEINTKEDCYPTDEEMAELEEE